jgi:putative transposase
MPDKAQPGRTICSRFRSIVFREHPTDNVFVDIDAESVRNLLCDAAGKSLPRHLSSDHDSLFRFHRWLANLRILEVEEIKSIPYVPVSHPFVERLIGTIRREFLDHVLIWNEFRIYYNGNRVHQSLGGSTPGERSGETPPAHAVLDHYAWRYHCRGLFQMPIAA